MNVCVIGGTGHIGRFLIPLLVENAHEVKVLTSGRTPTPRIRGWDRAGLLTCDYARGNRSWRSCVADVGAEVVIDILGNDLPGVYDAVRDSCAHLVACGSVWMFGAPRVVPTPPEIQGPCEFEGYAERYRELLDVRALAAADGVAFTAIMPPNICGPGKIPLDSSGGRDPECHRRMASGEPAVLPEACNTLIGPCDASDVARCFAMAVERRGHAADQVLNVGSAYALPAPDFVAAYGSIYGRTIPIHYVPPAVFFEAVVPDPGASFHFRHHMCPDITKTRELLNYNPEFTPEQSMERAIGWMRDEALL